MKKFKCKVEKTYEYEIEFNEKVWDKQALIDWSSVFCNVEDLQDLAMILAEYKTRFEAGEFIEGFGIPLINGKEPFVWENAKADLNHDVNINIIEEETITVDCEEAE